jgi:hypothetical protein
VEPVDPLSINEAYESIGANMPDHDRLSSRAHLLSRVPMNTRRCAHGVRGRAKPSMIISAELQFFLKKLVNQILNMEHMPMKTLAFYTRRCVC